MADLKGNIGKAIHAEKVRKALGTKPRPRVTASPKKAKAKK